jgi:phosphotransacetylase
VQHRRLKAAIEAAQAQLIEPVLVAPRAKLEAVAADAGLDLAGWRIEDVPHSHAAARAQSNWPAAARSRR